MDTFIVVQIYVTSFGEDRKKYAYSHPLLIYDLSPGLYWE